MHKGSQDQCLRSKVKDVPPSHLEMLQRQEARAKQAGVLRVQTAYKLAAEKAVLSEIRI